MRDLIKSMRKIKGATILAALFVILQNIVEILIPSQMSNLIDNGINKSDLTYIVKLGGILLLLAILALVMGIISGTLAARASTGFAADLRNRVFEKVQSFSFGNIDKFSTSSLITRLTTDINRMQFTFQIGIRILVKSPFLFIFAMIFAYRANPTIAVRIFWVIPIMLVITIIIVKLAFPWVEKTLKGFDEINSIVQENITGMEVVKTFNKEDDEKEKFKSINEAFRDAYIKLEKLNALVMPGVRLAISAAIIITIWMGVQAILLGNMTTGKLMSLMIYIFQIMMSITMLLMVFVMVIMTRVSALRVIEVLKEKPTIVSKANGVTQVSDGTIEFVNVSFSYGDENNNLTLTNINLKIPSGKTVGIIGGTGSGKTSLVQLIPRLYDVCKGTVTVGGVDVRDYDINSLRDAVSMVLQNNQLFKGTIASNLRWGNPNATYDQMQQVAIWAQADDFIKEMPNGYDSIIEQGGSNLSGGQRQRMTIARALMKNPKILILDDSTSAVDMETDRNIQDTFYQVLPNVTKLIITQRISSIINADMIVVMDGGVVNAVGTHYELLSSCSIYREINESQRGLVE
ncbi:MAG: ABC transporter ATP-binding protein [Tissierellia bacterium]|nr:ABC transporter ATP-binding protein [Tissierellia bacterium]